MDILVELMNERWISKYLNRDKYYRIKDEISEIRLFLVEKLKFKDVSIWVDFFFGKDVNW